MEQNSLQVMKYLDIALRRKWLIAVPFFLSAIVAFFVAATVPPVYKSSTTILVEPQQVPESFVQSTVTGSVQDRLSTISQQILSRTRLESVIRELNLYPELQKDRSMEAVVGNMRSNIEIDLERSRHRGGTAAFEISFYGGDPELVQRVTGKLASLYIEENLRVRETLARGTKEFLEKQLQSIEQELKNREQTLREFRQKYMGELPEQLETNLRSLDQLQNQKGALLDSLRDAEGRQILLDQQLAEMPQVLTGSGSDQNEVYRQLEARRQELAALRARYTDLYPDVARLSKEIEDLEKRIVSSQGSGRSAEQETLPLLNPAYGQLKSQADSNRVTIENFREELRFVDVKMRQMQRRVENVPEREQELMSLTRDYETIRQSYDSMMQRKMNAEVSENLENRQKSEQFRILDPANYPWKPVKPDRRKILAMGILVGLGLGGGLALGVEYLDRSFRSVEDVKASLTFPVLGIIPLLVTSAEQRRWKMRLFAVTSFSFGFILTLIVGVHLFVTRFDALVLKVVRLFQ